MNEKSKNLMIGGRFLVGLGIIGGLEYMAVVVKHSSPLLPFVGMIMQPLLAIVFLPPILTAIYFMFSSKMRWRVDFMLLLISIACIIGISSFDFLS
jgi:hypothetical protein